MVIRKNLVMNQRGSSLAKNYNIDQFDLFFISKEVA